MAKAKDEVVSAPVAEVVAGVQTPAQLYKQQTIDAKAKAEAVKRSQVLDQIKAEVAAYKPELRGNWIQHTEKNGTVSPAIIMAERFKGEDLILTLMVFSPNTAQPYRAERTF